MYNVLVSDDKDLYTAVSASLVEASNGVYSVDDDGSDIIDCPNLHIKSADYEIFIPMSLAVARDIVLKCHANKEVSLVAYSKRTFFNPDAGDLREISNLLKQREF